MKGKILYGIIGVLGAAIAIIPLTVCTQMVMACHTAKWAATFIGIAIIAIVVVFPVFRNIKNIAVSILLLVGGIAAFAVPRVFRLCGSPEMACRFLMSPMLTFFGSVIIILSLALLVRQAACKSKGTAAA